MEKVKYNILILLTLIFLGCNSESAWDCVKTPGAEILFEEDVGEFQSVTVQGHMDLVVIQDTLMRVQVKTRENLMGNIQFTIEDGMLYIEDESTCDVLRKRSYTTVYIYAPKLYTIRNASTGMVRNEGVWKQNKIGLICENHFNDSYYNNGVFEMNLEVHELNVLANGHSYFKLEGTAEKADMSVYAGNARIEASSMPIQEIDLYHRGTNHMLLYPTQAIRGEILNTGDVRIYNTPPIVEVDEKYLGSLVIIE